MMNGETEDYLWDGSGEPDPDVQELENVLGRLRHSGTAPKLPINEPASSVYKYAPMLAIAATILIVIGAGVWVALYVSAKGQPTDVISRDTGDSNKENPSRGVQPNVPEQQTPSARDEQNTLAAYHPPYRKRVQPLNPELLGLTREEIKAGREAKARLMLAMQIASSKLNQAKRRIQEDGHPSRS